MIKKIVISIILLSCTLMFQSYQIYKKTYSGYMFDYKYNMERVNIDNVVLSYNLLTIKHILPISSETVLNIFISDYNKYNIGLQYWFNKRNFYPITMPAHRNFVPLTDFTNDSFSRMITENKNNYVVLVGKNVDKLNVTTDKDISLYRVVSGNELELIYAFDNTLYNLRDNSEKLEKQEFFNETMKYINGYIDNYSNLYSEAAYNYIYQYADELYANGEVNEAMIYYNKYLSILSLRPDILLNKAKIYLYLDDYANTTLMLDSCEIQDECDRDAVLKIRNKMEETS